MKRFLSLLLCAASWMLNAAAQSGDSLSYDVAGNMPSFYTQLKQQLTYPMAWGNSPIKDFDEWRKAGRAKVFECMMTPPRRGRYAKYLYRISNHN